MRFPRRQFLTSALSLPFTRLGAAAAQTASKPAEIGFAYEGFAASAAARVKAFGEGLHSRGYDEGRNIITTVRTADTRQEQFEPMVRDRLGRDLRLLFVAGHAIVRMARQATTSTPIAALDLEADPVKDGQSIARPGGNMTGMFFDFPDFARKWLQLLTEALPNLKRLAVLRDVSTGEHQADAVAEETPRAASLFSCCKSARSRTSARPSMRQSRARPMPC